MIDEENSEIINSNLDLKKVEINPDYKYPLSGSNLFSLKEREAEILENHKKLSTLAAQSASIKAAPTLGEQETFNISDGGSIEDFIEVNATLKAIGDNSLFWIDNEIAIDQENIDKMRDEFENTIYTTVKNVFGRVPNANTFEVLNSTNDKVNILITPLVTSTGEAWAGGYFYTADLYSKSMYPESNERKIFYINHYDFDALEYQISTLAHEFQHMVFFNEKIINERPNFGIQADVWINEGLAQLAEDLVGYGYANGSSNYQIEFLKDTANTSLLHWLNSASDYGASYFFARYIYDRFGDGFIDYAHSSDESYHNAIATYTGLSFRELYEDWSLALLFDNIDFITESKYKIPSIEIPGVNGSTLEAGESWENNTAKGWSSIYTLIIEGDGSDLMLNIEDAAIDGEMWVKIYKGGQ